MPSDHPVIAGVVRCASCERRTIARRQRCLRCQRLMPFAYVRNKAVEQQLDLLSLFGIAAALVLLGGAVMLWFERPEPAIALATIAAAVGLSHALLRWFLTAWKTTAIAWTTLLVFAAIELRNDVLLAIVAASGCFFVVTFVMLVYRRLGSYLRGQRIETEVAPEAPAHGQCARCGRRAPQAVAPLWCVSLLFMTSVTIGKPKFLCAVHARINAIPATLFSAVFGWWGLPWGLIRTPYVLWQNASSGGQFLDRAVAQSLYDADRDGYAGWFNFIPGVRSKPIAILGLLLFMYIIFGSMVLFLPR
jgi:hypothetical protein